MSIVNRTNSASWGQSFEERLAIADAKQFRMFAVAAVVLFMVAATFLVPRQAWALGIDGLIADLIAPMIASASQLVDDLYSGITGATSIMGDLQDQNVQWNELLGGVYGLISGFQQTAVTPVAQQILTLVFMFRLLSISKVAESNDMGPLVPKLAFTMIGYFLMMYVVSNAMGIITVGYELMQNMFVNFNAAGGSHFSMAVTEDFLKEADISAGAMMVTFIFCFLVQVIFGFIAYTVAIFMYYGKILTLYFQALFAPIPMACIGLDSTRQWGLGYIKNVAANLLSLVIMFINLKIFPLLYTVIIGGMASGTEATGEVGQYIITQIASGLWPVSVVVPILALDTLLIFMLIKSSALAKDILGS